MEQACAWLRKAALWGRDEWVQVKEGARDLREKEETEREGRKKAIGRIETAKDQLVHDSNNDMGKEKVAREVATGAAEARGGGSDSGGGNGRSGKRIRESIEVSWVREGSVHARHMLPEWSK